MPSHRCRIPDSGDAPDRLRPLPFHHQRSPSSSLVNIPQDTSHNPRTRNPCNPHRPQNRVVTQSRYIRSRRHARHVGIRDPPYGAIDSPVLRLHGRALGVSDRPAPREPMTKPFLSRDFHLSDRTPPILMWQNLQRYVRDESHTRISYQTREVQMMTRHGPTPTSCLLRETTTPHSPCYARRTRSRAPRL